jgi:glycosyltransferase involved in cell wall biosynthesis
MIKEKHPDAELQLLGFIDSNNPSAVPEESIRAWEKEGILSWLGRADDVRPYIAEADCVVLPSYREGTPRSLLEAASMARPVITTDAVGCRQVVDHGQTGFLCQPRSAEDLAQTMERFLHLSDDERQAMGRKGRAKMLREFDEKIVLDKYLQAIQQILPKQE